MLVIGSLVAFGCGGSSSSHSSSTASASPRPRPAAVTKTSSTTHPVKSRFAPHAGLAFGSFHRWIYRPFRAGDFNDPLAHKVTVSKAVSALTFVIHEVNLAQQDAGHSRALSKVVAPLAAIATTLPLIHTGLASHGSGAAAVDSAAIKYVNAKINVVDTAARVAGQPITETTAGAKF